MNFPGNNVSNSGKSGCSINALRKSFKVFLTPPKSMAKFSNYKLSKLGDILSSTPICPFGDIYHYNPKSFSFRFITALEFKIFSKSLRQQRARGPSSVAAWELKDGKTELPKPITFLINRFNYEKRFPTHLKRAIITPFCKK